MTYIDIIGFLAGAFTTIALVPQAVKAWKTKHTKDVSFGWILIYEFTINSSLANPTPDCGRKLSINA